MSFWYLSLKGIHGRLKSVGAVDELRAVVRMVRSDPPYYPMRTVAMTFYPLLVFEPALVSFVVYYLPDVAPVVK